MDLDRDRLRGLLIKAMRDPSGDQEAKTRPIYSWSDDPVFSWRRRRGK